MPEANTAGGCTLFQRRRRRCGFLNQRGVLCVTSFRKRPATRSIPPALPLGGDFAHVIARMCEKH
ncbi:hypothetical protein KCP73_00995 [Salmonella enterica subsp. enterica]|nr:hypothetical protein KCP73_00995 [Salmonella enterica subsp. enterica]